jgi:hypothetical protein
MNRAPNHPQKLISPLGCPMNEMIVGSVKHELIGGTVDCKRPCNRDGYH